MIIRCSECGVQYRIDEGRLSDQNRIFRCSHCGEILRQPPSSDNPAPAEAQFVLVSCPDCGTKYRLSAQRLTEGKAGLRCRKCARIIPLRQQKPSRSLKVQVIRTDQPENKSATPHKPVFQTYSAASNAGKKRIFVLASAAAGLLVLILTGLFFGHPFLFPDRSSKHRADETRSRPVLPSAAMAKEPLVLLQTNLPALRREMQSRLPQISEDPRWRFTWTILDSAELKQAKLFVYADAASPVLVLEGSKVASLKEAMLPGDGAQQLLVPADGQTYRFSPAAEEIASSAGFPAESYRIWFHPGSMVCAPRKQAHQWKGAEENWKSFSVFQFAQTIEKQIELAGLAARIPEELARGWTESLVPDQLRRTDPRSGQRSDAAMNFLALLERSLQQIESMAGVFRFVGERGRLVQFAQQFRPDVDGNTVFSRLQSGDIRHDRTSIGAIFSALLHHDRLSTTVELRGNRLTVGLEWQSEDDKAILDAVLEAFFGPNRPPAATDS